MGAIQRVWTSVSKAMRKASTVEGLERLAHLGKWDELERALIDQGRPVDATPAGFRSLIGAVGTAPAPVIEALVSAGASPFERAVRRPQGFVFFSESLLETAALKQEWEAWSRLAQFALKDPAEAERARRANKERSLLGHAAFHFKFGTHRAFAKTDEQVLAWLAGAQALVAAGGESAGQPDPAAIELFDDPLLCLAGAHGLRRSTIALLAGGASVRARCPAGLSPEHWACSGMRSWDVMGSPEKKAQYAGEAGVLEILWDAGSDPSDLDASGRTPRDFLAGELEAKEAYDEARARWEARALSVAAPIKGSKATRGARL